MSSSSCPASPVTCRPSDAVLSSSSSSCPPSPVTRIPPDAVPSSSCPAYPATVIADDRVPSHMTGENPQTDPCLSSSRIELAITIAATIDDDRGSPATPDESIIEDWDQLLSTMENATLVQFDSHTGIMTFETSDTLAATVSPSSADDRDVSKRTVDGAMETSSELQSSVAEDSIVVESLSEVTIDNDSTVLDKEYPTLNELTKNLKRPFESEDEVVNNKVRPTEVDFDSFMSKIDILEPQSVSSDTDRMELIESDVYDSINKIEKESPYDDSQEYETINLISDSEETNLSEMSESQSESSESNVDSSIDDVLLNKLPDELLDNTLIDLKNECYKIYPQLLEIVNKEELIFHECENIFCSKNIIDNWMTEFNKKNSPSIDFIFNREKKWQCICREVTQRFIESVSILKLYEKYMEKCVHVQPYVVKKTDGLQVEFQSEKGTNLASELRNVSEEGCDSTRQSCSNTIEIKQLSSPDISKLSVRNCTAKNTNIINLTEDPDNEKPSELSMGKLISLQPESFATPIMCSHPVPLPAVPKQLNIESLKKLPPSPTLTVQNYSESRDRKAIVLRWNLNVNEEDFIEIICYQIFSYQEISSMKPTSSLWEKLTEVHALPLPMRCTLSFNSLKSGQKHYFAIRAVDKYFRLGPFSSVQFI